MHLVKCFFRLKRRKWRTGEKLVLLLLIPVQKELATTHFLRILAYKRSLWVSKCNKQKAKSKPHPVVGRSQEMATLNLPIPGSKSQAVIVKLYDIENKTFSLNEVVKFMGIVCLNPSLHPAPDCHRWLWGLFVPDAQDFLKMLQKRKMHFDFHCCNSGTVLSCSKPRTFLHFDHTCKPRQSWESLFKTSSIYCKPPAPKPSWM